MNTNIPEPLSLDISLTYIDPADEKLINLDVIKSLTQDYINNYNSDDYQHYLTELPIIYAKYKPPKHKYINTPNNTTIIQNTEGKTIVTIHKPKYVNVTQAMHDLEKQITQSRFTLTNKYYELLKKDITPQQKQEFETEKTTFIELLEAYYTYQYYDYLINKRAEDKPDKKLLTITDITQLEHTTLNENKIKLNCKPYYITANLIDEVNQYYTNKLDLINQIKSQFKSNQKQTDELKSMIKDYIGKSKLDELKQYIKTEQHKQDTNIDFIVIQRPKIDGGNHH